MYNNTTPICNPMDCSLPGSFIHGIFQARNWSGLPFSSPGDLADPGIKPMSLTSPALTDGFFITGARWEARLVHDLLLSKTNFHNPSRTCSHWFFLIEVQSFCFCSLTLSLTSSQLITSLIIFCVLYTPISSSKNFQTSQLSAEYNFHVLFETFMRYTLDDPSFRQIKKIWSSPGYPTHISKFILS